MLDLSAAFDTVSHDLLLYKLRSIGIAGNVLSWFSSYLSDRDQCVVLNGAVSATKKLKCGVPQGSVLGPILFTLYTSSLAELLIDCGVEYHLYADDTGIYISFEVNDSASAVAQISDCIKGVQCWMLSHRLKMNDSKTEVICFGTRHSLSRLGHVDVTIGGSLVNSSSVVKNLGVLLDSQLTMERHVTSTCKSAYFHLRNIARICKFLPRLSLERLIHAFIFSKLDYCNVLFIGLPVSLLRKLQLV